ncbi:hypothetical protein Tco_1066463 [Tanacetum coccineum]|uniref:Uncharacterized protein n=1 Tax=Tanacetum coccineum TaxID=301880 RepID=A0ABQ5HBG7_9ASTR
MKVKESLNVAFDESPPPTKLSPLVDDDVGEEEAIKNSTKVVNNSNKEDELIEVDEVVNIKESKNHPLEQVIAYLPRIYRSKAIDEEVKESYYRLESRLFHKGRFVTPSFIEANNMLPTFQAVGLEPFLTLNEPICPRFIVEFYHSIEIKRDEEERPYIEFKLANRFTFHDSAMNHLDISRNPIKENGKRVASPSASSSSSSSSDGNEAPSFLEFYKELFDNEDLTYA